MIKNIFFAAVSVLILSSCKEPQNDEAVVRQRDSLMAVIDQRESSVSDFVNTFNEVEMNLTEVSRKQNIIRLNADKSDLKSDQKARINEEIKVINALMESNTKKLKDLNKRLNKADNSNSKLKKTITTLQGQLNQKYFELGELNDQLNARNAQVAQLQVSLDTLYLQNQEQSETIKENTEALHTAYYIVGSSSDLIKWELVDQQGGFLGIGISNKLSNNLDLNMFTRIDYTQTTIIPVNSKHIKIVTTHPTGSFSLDKTGKMVNSIVISDPEKFWSASKYLVITK